MTLEAKVKRNILVHLHIQDLNKVIRIVFKSKTLRARERERKRERGGREKEIGRERDGCKNKEREMGVKQTDMFTCLRIY